MPKRAVTENGNVGIDWGNIENPTTVDINLSGTTVKTATDVETATTDISDRLPEELTTAGNIKADVEEVVESAAAATSQRQALLGVVTGTATGGSTVTMTTTDITEETTDHYKGRIIVWLTGKLAGQATDITGYSWSSPTSTFTFTAVTDDVENTDTFVIL